MRVKVIFPYMALLAVLVSGCSDSNNAETPSPTAAAHAPAQANARELMAKDYHVVETFNVGDGVFVRALAVEKNSNSLWVGTSVGVLQVSLASRDVLNTYTRKDGIANEYVFKIFIDSKGNKWFGTDGGGMSRFDGTWKTYFPMHGLADYWVYSFAEQADGTLWVGTWAGLNSVNPKSDAFTTYLEELVNEWVYGLDIDSKDRVWIGTEGGVNMFDGKKWSTWTHDQGLGAANEFGLPASDNTGLGTRSRHNLTVMASGMETYNPNYVFDILVTPQDTVWAGTWGGGAAYYDGSKWTNFTTKDGLSGNIVYAVSQAPDGAVWFGTNHGASRYDGKTWRSYGKGDGLIDENVYDIAISSNGDVWVGTRGGVTLLTM